MTNYTGQVEVLNVIVPLQLHFIHSILVKFLQYFVSVDHHQSLLSYCQKLIKKLAKSIFQV